MARGKYAEKSAKRQAELAVTNDLASYQHRVAKLTAENRELRERLAAQDRAAKQVERRLRAERDEGVAPQVTAIEMQLRAALQERDRARQQERTTRDYFNRAGARVCAHMVGAHGMSIDDARSWYYSTLAGIGDPDSVMFPVDEDEERALRKPGVDAEAFQLLRSRKQPGNARAGL